MPAGDFFDRYGRPRRALRDARRRRRLRLDVERRLRGPGPGGARRSHLQAAPDRRQGAAASARSTSQFDAPGLKSDVALQRDLRRALTCRRSIAMGSRGRRRAADAERRDRRRRHRRPDARARAAPRRHRLPRLRGRAPRSGRSGVGINVLPHASAALRVARRARGARARRRADARVGVLQPLRPARLQRAGRPLGRPRRAAALDPPRRPAGRAARGRARAASAPIASSPATRASASTTLGDARVRLRLARPERRARCRRASRAVAVGCDGIHSALRRQLHPDEGPPRWSGVNMWRGVTPHAPFLSGATMVRAGWLSVGKMVIYPIRNDIDGAGRQLVNWVAELECRAPVRRDWNARGRLDDFLPTFADWHFDWLDVAGADPLDRDRARLSDGRPGPAAALELRPHHAARRRRASDGAARLERRRPGDPRRALPRRAARSARPRRRSARRSTTASATRRRRKVVLANRSTPPDAILREVHERSGDKPFARIEDVVSRETLAKIADELQAGRRPAAPRRRRAEENP